MIAKTNFALGPIKIFRFCPVVVIYFFHELTIPHSDMNLQIWIKIEHAIFPFFTAFLLEPTTQPMLSLTRLVQFRCNSIVICICLDILRYVFVTLSSYMYLFSYLFCSTFPFRILINHQFTHPLSTLHLIYMYLS